MKVIFLTERIDHSLVTHIEQRNIRAHTHRVTGRVALCTLHFRTIEEGVNNDGKILFPPKNNTKKMRNLFDMNMEREDSGGGVKAGDTLCVIYRTLHAIHIKKTASTQYELKCGGPSSLLPPLQQRTHHTHTTVLYGSEENSCERYMGEEAPPSSNKSSC